MQELRRTDYFMKIKQLISENKDKVTSTHELKRRMRSFDQAGTGVMKAYALVNVLKHAFEAVFPDDCMLGLQFQLECLSTDGNVDY